MLTMNKVSHKNIILQVLTTGSGDSTVGRRLRELRHIIPLCHGKMIHAGKVCISSVQCAISLIDPGYHSSQ